MLGVFCADQHKPRVDRAISAMVNQMRVLITDGGEFMHAVRRDRSSHRDALRLIDQFLFGAGVYPSAYPGRGAVPPWSGTMTQVRGTKVAVEEEQ